MASGREQSWLDRLIYAFTQGFGQAPFGLSQQMEQAYDQYQEGKDNEFQGLVDQAQQSGDYLGLQGQLAQSGLHGSSDFEKWLDNMIAAQNTQSARNWEEKMSETDLLKAASQLQQLGLSASGVLQTGGSQVNAVGAADNSKTNIAFQRYAQKMAIAKQLLGMTSQMASAGVYGHAIGAARRASSVVTSAASHSALRALSPTRFNGDRAQMLQELADLDPQASEGELPF